jgi:hypothetical protein
MKTRLFHTKHQPSWLFYSLFIRNMKKQKSRLTPIPNLHDWKQNQYTPVIPYCQANLRPNRKGLFPHTMFS